MNLNQKKYKLRLPNVEEVVGKDRLSVITKRGGRAKVTPFASMMGAYCYDDMYGRYYLANLYDTENARIIDPSNLVLTNSENYYIKTKHVPKNDRKTGIRLVLIFGSDDFIPTNGEEPKIASDGVLEVEFGYLPKYDATVYDTAYHKRLSKAEEKGKFKRTSYEYTTDYRRVDFCDVKSENGNKIIPNKRTVFKYRGKLFIKQKYLGGYYDIDYEEVRYNDNEYYVEVLPVKWLADLEAGIMITEDIVWAGIEFDNIQKYIDDYLSNELVQIEEKDRIGKKSIKKYKKIFSNLFHRKNKLKQLSEGIKEIEQNQNDLEMNQTIPSEDSEIYPQQPHYAKPQAVTTDRIYYVQGNDGDIYPTRDPNNSDYYIGSDGVLRPTKEPIENQHEDSAQANNQYVARITVDKLFKKPNRSRVDLSKPPYETKEDKEYYAKKQREEER